MGFKESFKGALKGRLKGGLEGGLEGRSEAKNGNKEATHNNVEHLCYRSVWVKTLILVDGGPMGHRLPGEVDDL